MAVGKMPFRRNPVGYKHIHRTGSTEQNSDTGKAPHGFKILSLSGGTTKFLRELER